MRRVATIGNRPPYPACVVIVVNVARSLREVAAFALSDEVGRVEGAAVGPCDPVSERQGVGSCGLLTTGGACRGAGEHLCSCLLVGVAAWLERMGCAASRSVVRDEGAAAWVGAWPEVRHQLGLGRWKVVEPVVAAFVLVLVLVVKSTT